MSVTALFATAVLAWWSRRWCRRSLPPAWVCLVAPAAAPALAYVAGVLGTLLGADVRNLRRVRALGAPVVSIGGAATFDGICLTGVIAVLIASL